MSYLSNVYSFCIRPKSVVDHAFMSNAETIYMFSKYDKLSNSDFLCPIEPNGPIPIQTQTRRHKRYVNGIFQVRFYKHPTTTKVAEDGKKTYPNDCIQLCHGHLLGTFHSLYHLLLVLSREKEKDTFTMTFCSAYGHLPLNVY